MSNYTDEFGGGGYTVIGDQVCTIREIKIGVQNIMKKYDAIEKVYLFGSYARGEAKSDSDIDIMIKLNDDNSFSLLTLSSLANNLIDKLKKEVDIILEETYTEEIKYDTKEKQYAKNRFYNEIRKDMILIYERRK